MSYQFTEVPEPSSPKRMSELVIYSARIQEAMRYDKLNSTDYRLVMTIKDAVSKDRPRSNGKRGRAEP